MASSNLVNSFDRDNVVAFLEQRANGDYVPQSGQIVGILKNMKDEMEKDIATEKAAEATEAAAAGDVEKATESAKASQSAGYPPFLGR